jgi:inorganic triphosphatase YgiF
VEWVNKANVDATKNTGVDAPQCDNVLRDRRNSVQEIEIKLQVPRPRRDAVLAAIRRGQCASTRLHALYFDTPARSLQAAGLVLRLRREANRWIQAVKGPGDGLLARLEHEVDCGTSLARPALDLTRHDGTSAGRALKKALAGDHDALAPLFEVDVRRIHRCVRHAGATIELALDEGWIRCGDAKEPVCELELELKTGPVEALIGLASRWTERHGLWFDSRTKSERGALLADGRSARPAAVARVPRLSAHDSADAVVRTGTRAALAQLLPNASALAAGQGGPEHVHQARVALRRMLSLWRVLGAVAGGVDPRRVEAASSLFDRLGAVRDRDVLEALWLPRLREAGAPPITLDPPDEAASPAEVCRDPAVTLALLDCLRYAQGEPATAGQGSVDLMRKRLGRLHRRLRRAGEAFASLTDEERHRARRQLKRLRYCADTLSSLFPPADWASYLVCLKAAQEALGHLQDWAVAHAYFEARDPCDAGVWFARGWLAGQREPCIVEAGRALAAVGKTPRFLR